MRARRDRVLHRSVRAAVDAREWSGRTTTSGASTWTRGSYRRSTTASSSSPTTRGFDYKAMVAEADLIVDTRNAIKTLAPNVFRLGAPQPAAQRIRSAFNRCGRPAPAATGSGTCPARCRRGLPSADGHRRAGAARRWGGARPIAPPSRDRRPCRGVPGKSGSAGGAVRRARRTAGASSNRSKRTGMTRPIAVMEDVEDAGPAPLVHAAIAEVAEAVRRKVERRREQDQPSIRAPSRAPPARRRTRRGSIPSAPRGPTGAPPRASVTCATIRVIVSACEVGLVEVRRDERDAARGRPGGKYAAFDDGRTRRSRGGRTRCTRQSLVVQPGRHRQSMVFSPSVDSRRSALRPWRCCATARTQIVWPTTCV